MLPLGAQAPEGGRTILVPSPFSDERSRAWWARAMRSKRLSILLSAPASDGAHSVRAIVVAAVSK